MTEYIDDDHGNKGNQHARKPMEDKATSFLHVRCSPSDKAGWVRAAKGGKLAQWVVKSLNEAAKPGATG
jgi:hypothetical protein